MNLAGQSIGLLKSLILKELIQQVKTQFDDESGFRDKKYIAEISEKYVKNRVLIS